MKNTAEISLYSFALVYLLLLIVIAIMKKAHIDKSKLLIWASFRMTVQLIIAGHILTFLFKNPHPLLTIGYLVMMVTFALYRVLRGHQILNRNFRFCIASTFIISSCIIPSFFVIFITRQNFLNPQYTIPIAGMLIGNAMTGFNLALNTFQSSIDGGKDSIKALLMIGVHPKKILIPHMNKSLETALLPTINAMLGMGVVSLPGMLTGQILAGELPNTAILYQITIMIAITTMICLSVFTGLYFGIKTLYNKNLQFNCL